MDSENMNTGDLNIDNQNLNCGDVIIFEKGFVHTIEKISEGIVYFDGSQIPSSELKDKIWDGVCMRIPKDEDDGGTVSDMISFINNVIYISRPDA